jgi:DNA-binding SARP family transcriptional activator
MPFRLELLGPPRLLDDAGLACEMPAGKPLALLAFLALSPAPVSRAELAKLLWSRVSDRSGRASLRQALFVLRRDLDAELIKGEESIRLAEGVVETDVAELREHLVNGHAREAAALWRGRFAQDLTVQGAPEFERWGEDMGGRLARDLSAALLLEARSLRAHGAAADALPLLEMAARIDEFSPWPRLRLAEAWAEAGNSAALSLLSEIERDPPNAEIAAEVTRIKRIVRGETARTTLSNDRSRPAPLPFVGREGELAVLAQAWREVREGAGRVVALVGPPGIGKTRLAREFERVIAADGGRSVPVRGIPAERPIPLGVIADLAGALGKLAGARGVTEASEAVLATLLPSTARRAKPWPSTGSEELAIFAAALSDAMHDLLGAVAFEGPVVLLVDDLQWTDTGSQAVLFRIARHAPGGCLLLLIERQANGLSSLQSEAEWRVPVGPLTTDEVAELLHRESVVGGPRTRELAEQIRRITAGNPLFLSEALRLLQDPGRAGVAASSSQRALTDEQIEHLLPRTLRDTIRRRLESLAPGERQVLVAAVRRPGPQEAVALRAECRLAEVEFRDAMGGLLARELLERTDSGRFAFTHEEIREAATEFLPEPRMRRRWVRAASVALLVGSAGTAVALVGGDPPPAPYGGGMIYQDGGSIFHLVGSGADATVERRPVNRFDRTVQVVPFITTAGDTLWVGSVIRDEQPPAAVVIEQGRTIEIFSGAGDAGVLDVAPDGSHVLLYIEDVASPIYDQDLWLARVDGTNGRKILDTDSRIQRARWSPDGRLLAVTFAAATDSLLVLRPNGERLGALGLRGAYDLAWCGSDRLVVNAVRETGDRPRLWLVHDLDRSTPTLIDLALEPRASGTVSCSPDGSAVVSHAIVNGEIRGLIEPVDGGAPPLPLPAGDPGRLVWLAERRAPVVARIAVQGDTGVLRRGERRQLLAQAWLSDGRRASTPIRWETSDPSIASVSREGVLTANRAGVVGVVASADGWPADSLHFTIDEAAAPGALFRESFETLSADKWLIHGSPTPRAIRTPEGPALRLMGDGQYHDGVYSRQTFDAALGLTIEIEASISVTRPQQQRLDICLVEIAALEVASTGWSPAPDQYLCFSYPADEGLKFDPYEAHLLSNRALALSIRLDSLLGDGSWHRYALQIEPDGTGSVVIDGVTAGTTALKLRPATAGYRVSIQGKAVDTEVLVRDLAVWSGLRYGR